MELKAHFSSIHKVIIGHLEDATSEIVAAIAWLTDRDIFGVLCKQSRVGIRVSIALIGDEINRGPGGLNFNRLKALGGKIAFLPTGRRDEPIMHHKFCVIDRATVITGSYNWSHKARNNDENITVVTEAPDFASKYLETFDDLLSRTGQSVDISEAAKRRLETIRNLILLGEYDDVASHLRKLQPVAEALELTRIVIALDNYEYRNALELIDTHLRKTTDLVMVAYADVARLRFRLETLEIRLESLSDEKVELERGLVIFNRRHYEALGDLIQRILHVRARHARHKLDHGTADTNREGADSTSREAEKVHAEYCAQYEELKCSKPLPVLDSVGEKELKSIYRNACSLCHPDKVTEDMKEAAHRVFVELQEAYKSNDLALLRSMYETLRSGGIPAGRSVALNEVGTLTAAIDELERLIARLVDELRSLQDRDSFALMNTAGVTEADWQRFFSQQRRVLLKELARIELEAQSPRTEEICTDERTTI